MAYRSEVASTVAREIKDAFREHEGPKWYIDEEGNERPNKLTVVSPTLTGSRREELEWYAHDPGIEHAISYEPGNLRKGAGIILRHLESIEGEFTGNVGVQPACDDFDL